jgi:threonine dehydrogenase-like Zn-dependent dehydrogenase
LRTLSDVLCTGHHAAVTAGANPRTTVTVIGDGAVGLSAVIAAKRLGAGRILLMGRHKGRTDLGLEFGATDIVAERGEEGIVRIRELTGGDGTHTVLECVGTQDAIDTAIAAVRNGGAIGRVGAAQYTDVPMNFDTVMRNIALTGGVAPHWPTSKNSCRTSSREHFSPARCLTILWPSTTSLQATGRWPTAPCSKCSFAPKNSTQPNESLTQHWRRYCLPLTLTLPSPLTEPSFPPPSSAATSAPEMC